MFDNMIVKINTSEQNSPKETHRKNKLKHISLHKKMGKISEVSMSEVIELRIVNSMSKFPRRM